MNDRRSAWREPMVWLVFGIPAATVLAGLATLAIALRAGSIDPIAAPVSRLAKAQVTVGTLDETATRGGYRGMLRIEREGPRWRLGIETSPVSLADRPVQVLFVHPTLASRDVRVLLDNRRTPDIQAPDFVPQQVIVTDVAGNWRLVGSYDERSQLELMPALAAP